MASCLCGSNRSAYTTEATPSPRGCEGRGAAASGQGVARGAAAPFASAHNPVDHPLSGGCALGIAGWAAVTPFASADDGPSHLRVSLGEHGETGIKEALETGDSSGFVHSFTTGSSVDGPGVRVVAWLAGCQFRCLYCHNPDTWKMTNGLPVAVARALEVVSQYKHSLSTMKGGLTISGGEPLMQHRFVLKVFAAAKQAGLKAF